MGWFSRKQPRSADDALVERTLAVAQEVAQEQPDDEQSLLALIDGIKMMPPKPAPAVVADEAALPGERAPSPLSAISLPPVTLSSVSMATSSPSPIMIAKAADEPLYPPASKVALPEVETSQSPSTDRVLPNRTLAVPALPAQIPATRLLAAPIVSAPNPPMTTQMQPASPPVLRPAVLDRVRQPDQRRPIGPPPKQSEMRREIAQRVQNFKAHQQRLNDEREARIKKIYADMQARLEKSGAPKSPPVS